ncbi:MAG: anthranilate phosphoribosyltransferase [Verrucomicrobia bacterium]|nr:anthranilate phosphoribosyltransferase [Verrucomicrobiota bacterium]
MLRPLIDQLTRGQSLAGEQVGAAISQLIDERVPADLKADFLIALTQKGETDEEIAAFARGLRDLSLQPSLDAATRGREILDVVGTGGDRLNTFNISTTVALVAAAAGVTVAKHGNRAVTSQSGSADVLEALGVKIDLTPEQAARWLREHHFVFFFAPRFHPAFKNIAPARKLCAERGQRTIFNFLGPLLNPARPTAQLVGVPQPQMCEPIGRVLQSLGVRRGMVVCGAVPESKLQSPKFSVADGGAWLDELSTLGESTIAEFYQEHGFNCSTLDPAAFPLQPATLEDLVGADAKANADIVWRLLLGEDLGPKRDAVLLNAAAALLVAGRARSLSDGWELAAEVIDCGAATRKLSELIEAGGT